MLTYLCRFTQMAIWQSSLHSTLLWGLDIGNLLLKRQSNTFQGTLWVILKMTTVNLKKPQRMSWSMANRQSLCIIYELVWCILSFLIHQTKVLNIYCLSVLSSYQSPNNQSDFSKFLWQFLSILRFVNFDKTDLRCFLEIEDKDNPTL